MQKIILLLLLSIAVTFSVLARADRGMSEVSVSVHSMSFDATQGVIKVDGVLPNPCTTSPRPRLNLSKDNETLVLDVVATPRSEVCIMVIGGRYELAFDVRSLKSELVDLKLNPTGAYRIRSADGSVVFEVDFSKFAYHLPYSTNSLVGGVFAVENGGEPLLTLNSEEALTVKSPFIDIEKYDGQLVEVLGHLQRARPTAFGIDDAGESHPSFLVTGISIITD